MTIIATHTRYCCCAFLPF